MVVQKQVVQELEMENKPNTDEEFHGKWKNL